MTNLIKNQNIFNIVPSYGLSLDWNKTDNPFVVSFSLNNNPEIKSWNIASSIGVLGSVGEKKWHHFLLLKNNLLFLSFFLVKRMVDAIVNFNIF